MRAPRTLRRSIDRFFEDPASMRNAALLIVGATSTAVVLGSIVIRVFDRREYPNIGRAMWFTLQTVTTVGYGDVTPHRIVGRLVAAVVMLAGIGFITVVTAAITSTFVEATRRRAAERTERMDSAATAAMDFSGALESIRVRLEQIESALQVLVDRAP
jgi:voltage-gated potassium channel